MSKSHLWWELQAKIFHCNISQKGGISPPQQQCNEIFRNSLPGKGHSKMEWRMVGSFCLCAAVSADVKLSWWLTSNQEYLVLLASVLLTTKWGKTQPLPHPWLANCSGHNFTIYHLFNVLVAGMFNNLGMVFNSHSGSNIMPKSMNTP